MESRYSTMIENAFYYSNPPDVQQTTKKVRPPMHEYIRKLLYKDLSKVTTEKVSGFGFESLCGWIWLVHVWSKFFLLIEKKSLFISSP